MPVLERCWAPFVLYSWTNLRNGTYYAAIYTTVIHILFICYTIYVLMGGDSDEFYTPFFELDDAGLVAAGAFSIIFSLLFLMAALMLVMGVKRENRGMFFPWMIGMTIEILVVIAFGMWLIGRYYRNLYSVLAAIIIWGLDGIHIYCLLCVISQYQLLRDLQEPRFLILYP